MLKLIRMSSLVAVAGLCATAPLSAQPADSNDIVVSAALDQAGVSQRVVHYRDLALGSPSGQARLMHRVGYAIDSLCENSVASPNPVGALKCSNGAWDSVRPQLDELLRR